jgi:trimeric autotransporter adhesin
MRKRTLIGGRKLPALLRPFVRFVRVVIFVQWVGLLPAWAAPATTTTTLSVTSAGNAVATVTSGTVVTLTATVMTSSTPVAPGQINFCDATAKSCTDIHLLGSAQLTSAGTATLHFRPAIGSHTYQAVFVGTNANAASSSAASTLTVTGIYPTMTNIVSRGAPGDYSLTATVLGNGHVSPTGKVSFLDTSNSNQVLATATLTPGTAGLNLIPSMLPEFSPTSLAVGDFNGDGIPDLAVSEFGIDILLGNGDGTFKPRLLAPGNLPYIEFIAVGDFNGDGKLDLAVAYCNDAFPTTQPGTVEILLGNGDGTFNLAAASPATGNTPTAIATGDFNGDGNLDLAISNGDSNTVTILLGNGNGTFTTSASPATGNSPSSLVVGDFNGDGKPDLAVTNATDNTVTILLGNGDGTFKAAASPVTGNRPSAIAAGDFNGNGKVDLAVANAAGNTITILLGNGDGTFTAATGPAIAGPLVSPIAVGDFNGDGIADLAVGGNAPALFLGNGDGTFTPSAPLSPFVYPIQSVVAADLDGDGIADVVDSTEGPDSDGGSVTVFLTETQSATATANGIAVSPVNGNAATHAVVASYLGDAVYSGSISSPVQLASGAANFSLSGTPLSVAAGASANAAITVTPNGAFTGTVALQCSVSAGPSGGTGAPTCSISPQANITGILAVTAMLTVTTQAATTTVGSYTITVTGASGGSTVTTNIPLTVTAPPVAPNFTLTNTTVTIASPGATGTSTITVTPSGGFTGSVALSCTVTGPAGSVDPPVCSVTQPAAITGTGAVTATLTVNTTVASASLAGAGNNATPYFTRNRAVSAGGGMILSALLLFGVPVRRSRWKTFFMLLLIAAASEMAIGCGGGANANKGNGNPGTTPGKYTVTVTGVAGATMATTHVTVTLN